MREVPEYLLALGGKRIRPTLTLLVTHALGADPAPQAAVEVAAGIELIHMATLLHDDIIDNSSLRRHKPSPLSVFGMPNTLLSGDFLLVRAFGLCAMLEKEIIAKTEEACIELVEGESLETPLYQERHSRESSITIAKKKTASLFRLGAFAAGRIVNPTTAAKLSEFGEKLGIAFQILDDVLDVASDEATLGKKPGTDIRERKPSLVNVSWLEKGSALANRLLVKPEGEEGDYIAAAMEEIRSGTVLSECRAVAERYSQEAMQALDAAIPAHSNPAADKLRELIAFTIQRLS
jgi:geranylgeranyl pyrophosphate synthase